MADLFTPVRVPEVAEKLAFDAALAVVGSCFSERLAAYLGEGGIRIHCNPCGIVYNAVSMARSLRHLAAGHEYGEKNFFERDGLWFSWEHHGAFARPELAEAMALCNQSMNDFRAGLMQAQVLILTFSSSVVYELKETGEFVANCHKVPGTFFNRHMLSHTENKEAIRSIVRSVREIRPDLRIVMTLSPVRHYPGDLVLNARSKANLLSAIHDSLDDKCIYFPSYEIMTDELRDYRFYRDDMLHPSDLASGIICGRFTESFFSAGAVRQIDECRRQAKQAAHRPIHGDADA